MKNVSQCVGNFFQRLIQMLHKTLKTRTFRSVATRLNIVNSALFTRNKYSIEHQTSASERIWFCLIYKKQFAATYIKTFAEQQTIPTKIRNTEQNWLQRDLFGSLPPDFHWSVRYFFCHCFCCRITIPLNSKWRHHQKYITHFKIGMNFPELQSFTKSEARLHVCWENNCLCRIRGDCVTWDDDLRMIKTAIPSVDSNREQLEAFQRFFEAQLCFQGWWNWMPWKFIYFPW